MSTSTTGTRADAIEFLTSQHREVDQLWSQLQASHGQQADIQHDQAREIVKMVSQHDALETQLLYPELRDNAGEEGKKLSEHALSEHQRVRELLDQVDGADISDAKVFSTMSEAISEVKHHVEEEEHKLFPLLRKHVEEPRLMDLGQKMADMMDNAPTHPHPNMPDSKAGATVAGAAAGMMDKARDAIEGDGK